VSTGRSVRVKAFPASRRKRVGRCAAVLLLALACAFAGCGGGGDDGSSAGAAAKPATLKVGVIPIADVAPLYLGMQKGFFRQQSLTIKPQLAQGGAAIVPAVVSGGDQIGFSNTTSLIVASSKKLPLQIISQGVLGGRTPRDAWDAVLVKGNSRIRTAKDLEGKTVAVNTLQNVGPLTINTALRNRHVDFKKVKYTEVEFPDMPAALDAGRVDAAWMVEPFVSQSKATGARAILTPYEETAPNLTVATYFASKAYIKSNGDVVNRFVTAMNRSLTYAQSHPAEVRRVVLTYTKIPPKAASAMKLPQWRADLNRPTIQRTAQLAKDYGFVKSVPNLNDLIRTP
jgi:NitT/TauT family transport system substrate-binding protein